jgi:hypothetical protein
MPRPNGWGFGPTLNHWRIIMDTKIVSMIDKRGNVQNMKLEPLSVIAPRMWRDFALHKAKSGNGKKLWKNKASFLSHLRTAFSANRIELSSRDIEASSNTAMYAYDACVLEYVETYLELAKKTTTKRGVVIFKSNGLVHDPLFPKVHKEKGSKVIVVNKHVPTTKEIKVTEFIPRPESKLVKAIGRLRSRISNAIKGARNSIASRIAAD